MSGPPPAGIGIAWTASQYQTKRTPFNVPAGVWTLVLRGDVRRWYLDIVIGPYTGVASALSPGPTPSNTPLVIGPSPVMPLKWRDSPALITGEWYAFAPAPADLLIIEELYVGR